MLNTNFLLKSCIRLPNYQTIRWIRPRKPFWLGIAKSKLFVIREKRVLPEPENSEYQRLMRLYNTNLKSLLHFIRHENPLATEKKESDNLVNFLSNERIDESLLQNEIWNAKSEELRNERLKILAQNALDDAVTKISNSQIIENKMQKKIKEIVQKEIEMSMSYVTFENLDEAVEKCLDSEVDYNFAIDINGNKYFGKKPFQELETNSNTNKPE